MEKIINCQEKIEEWKNILNSNKETNVLLKTALSEILKNKFDQSPLDTIEEFQTRFVEEDQKIERLRKEVNQLDDILRQSDDASEQTENKILVLQDKLENEVYKSAQRFEILKNAFYHFKHRVIS